MPRLLDKSLVPITPKSFTGTLANGQQFRIQWRSQYEPWNTFVSQVNRFHADNGLPLPSEDQIEEQIAAQVPRSWQAQGQSAAQHVARTVTRGCKNCGKW